MNHHHTLTVQIADTEIEVEASFSFTPGCPETGPSYASGGEPATGPEIEVQSGIVHIGKMQYAAPEWLLAIIQGDEGLIERLSDSIGDLDEAYDADAAYEASRDEAA